MKKNFKMCIAAAVSAALTLSTVSFFASAGASTNEQPTTCSVSYNLESLELDTKTPELFEETQFPVGSSYTIPAGTGVKEGFYFTGWTYDNVLAYQSGDNFIMPNHDIVLEPIWVKDDDETFHNVSYLVEIDGTVIESEKLETQKHIKGQVAVISLISFSRDGYAQLGWTDGTNVFKAQEKMIVHDHDVVLEPHWLKYYDITYTTGDVDRVNGATSFTFERYETNTFDLAAASRLSRSGFNLTGWHCSEDNKVYSPFYIYTMPSNDVTFTAVWTPITYNIVFRSNNGKNENIKISGETDTTITVPECTSTKDGFKFAGWQFNDEVYQPGDEFLIKGAMPGVGIALSAIWTEDSEPVVDTYDAFSLIKARQDYSDGKIDAEELQSMADFILCR